jgi:acyl-CoA dehydrogenase
MLCLLLGTVSFESKIFSGSPELRDLHKYKQFLTAEEQLFLDKEVNELCELVDNYQVSRDRDLPEEFWLKCKETGIFGLMIAKEYGGKAFSHNLHSQVLQKISSRSGDAAATVAVPNSLGPAELIMHYGTQQQKDYFLPRLASGELIPCFALTAPHSGSDAASSIEAEGTVVVRDGVLGILASFNKRYITLAPVAGVFGVTFQLKDPSGLLNGCGSEGLTAVLLERDHPGLEAGPRHDPLQASFMNGTVRGKVSCPSLLSLCLLARQANPDSQDVFVPMTSVIGGQSRCGFGWNMIVECLSVGRAVSLPASASGGARAAVLATGGGLPGDNNMHCTCS